MEDILDISGLSFSMPSSSSLSQNRSQPLSSSMFALSKSNNSFKSLLSSSSNQSWSSSMFHSSKSQSSKQHESQYSSSSSHRPSCFASASSKPPRPTKQGARYSSSKTGTGITKQQIEIPSHLHRHKLLTLTPAGTLFHCNGCREQGCGLSYRCENRDYCNYVLHEECARAVVKHEKTTTHGFFKGKIFKFLEEPEGRPSICDACRMEVKGFVYHHREPSKDLYDTGLDLHPCCLKLKERIISDEESSIRLTLQRDVPKKCVQCKHHKVKGDSRVGGWSYLSSDGDCFHVSCFKKLILETLQKEGFSDGKEVIIVASSKRNNNNNNQVVHKVGERSSSSSAGLKIAEVVVAKTATTVIIKLLFSLLIGGGHPIAVLPAFLGLLAASFH